jgi:3-hydroxybutyryl-CoA dehydratase
LSRSRPPLPAVSHVIGREQIDAYARLSGDFNPLHMDPEFAAGTQFGTVIAHGPIALQVLFEALTSWLGADGASAGVTIDVRFRSPVLIDDELMIGPVEVAEHAGQAIVTVTCVNQRGDSVLEGLVVVPSVLAPDAS